jgi:hypothetical protein
MRDKDVNSLPDIMGAGFLLIEAGYQQNLRIVGTLHFAYLIALVLLLLLLTLGAVVLGRVRLRPRCARVIISLYRRAFFFCVVTSYWFSLHPDLRLF